MTSFFSWRRARCTEHRQRKQRQEDEVKTRLSMIYVVMCAMVVWALPSSAVAQGAGTQQNVPQPVQEAAEAVERTVEAFGVGVVGGVGIDPELIAFGGHATFAPIFSPNVEFRPGVEFGLGEVTTIFGINLDIIYFFPGSTTTTRWSPYVGVGPTLGLSHRGFEADDSEHVDIDGIDDNDDRNRFDFGDSDFNGGANFIVGARSPRGVFFEMRATAGGVSNIRLLGGFNF